VSRAELAAIRERYQCAGTPKPLWQEVCIDIAALLAEVGRLSARLEAFTVAVGAVEMAAIEASLRRAGKL